jgi:threonine aldolase
VPGVRFDPARVETNIVIFEVDDAPALIGALTDAGVQASVFGPHRVRMVTHLDVDRAGCERALSAVREALSARAA